MRCRRMMFPASIWIKSNERAAVRLAYMDGGVEGPCVDHPAIRRETKRFQNGSGA
jgi:hypothetical protein